jgi:hypothetical protein
MHIKLHLDNSHRRFLPPDAYLLHPSGPGIVQDVPLFLLQVLRATIIVLLQAV